MRTAVPGARSFTARSTASPSTLRIRRSVTTRSKTVSSRARTAASPPSARMTSYPSCLRVMSSSSRMLGSSSTTRTRALGMALRQAQRELRTGVPAPRGRLAAVLLCDPVDEREAEPAFPIAHGEERFEDVRQLVGQNAVAGVGEGHLDDTADGGRSDPQLAADRHRGHGVEAQIPDRLPEPVAVSLEVERPWQVANDLDTRLGQPQGDTAQDFVDHRCEIDQLDLQ